MEKSIEVEIPAIPSFIKLNLGTKNTQENYNNIPIQDFTDSELKKIGKEWTEKLLEEAAKKRKS